MALQLSRREVDDLRSSLDRAIYRTIGKSDNSLLSTVSSCLTNGYERRKIIDKISSHIDSKKANKLADKVLALAQELISSSKSQKRKHESDRDKDSKESKKSRYEDKESRHEERDRKEDRDSDIKDKEKKFGNGIEVLPLPLSIPEGETVGSKIAVLSADRIKLMMANAQKEIEERKRALTVMKGDKPGVNAAVAAAQHLKVQMQQSNSIPPPSVIKPVLYSKPDSNDVFLFKAQLEKLQNEISQIARKTGISSATKLALLASDAPDSDRVPDIEWWDSVILMTPEERETQRKQSGDQLSQGKDARTDVQRVVACNTGEDEIVDNLNLAAVTNLVEHPQQLRAP
ncbi:hypothetical protein ACJJTC_009542, partial [Scirpophaga incertulas]